MDKEVADKMVIEATRMTKAKDNEARAREIVDEALQDHDAGGYQFAGLNEIMRTKIAQALENAEKRGMERVLEDTPKKHDYNHEVNKAYQWALQNLKQKDPAIAYEYGVRAGIMWLRAELEKRLEGTKDV